MATSTRGGGSLPPIGKPTLQQQILTRAGRGGGNLGGPSQLGTVVKALTGQPPSTWGYLAHHPLAPFQQKGPWAIKPGQIMGGVVTVPMGGGFISHYAGGEITEAGTIPAWQNAAAEGMSVGRRAKAPPIRDRTNLLLGTLRRGDPVAPEVAAHSMPTLQEMVANGLEPQHAVRLANSLKGVPGAENEVGSPAWMQSWQQLRELYNGLPHVGAYGRVGGNAITNHDFTNAILYGNEGSSAWGVAPWDVLAYHKTPLGPGGVPTGAGLKGLLGFEKTPFHDVDMGYPSWHVPYAVGRTGAGLQLGKDVLQKAAASNVGLSWSGTSSSNLIYRRLGMPEIAPGTGAYQLTPQQVQALAQNLRAYARSNLKQP